MFICIGFLDAVSCDCSVPCNQTKYTAEVSYSKFPDIGTAEDFVSKGYYHDIEYQRYFSKCCGL